MKFGRHTHNRGFTLVELSIATALYSVGIGSFSLLLLVALQGTVESSHRSTAVIQAESLAEMVLMNPDAVGHYVYPASASSADCDSAPCSPEQLAYAHFQRWNDVLTRELPYGKGLVCRDSSPDDGNVGDAACDGSGGPVIKIFWQEPERESAEAGNPPRLVTRLPLP